MSHRDQSGLHAPQDNMPLRQTTFGDNDTDGDGAEALFAANAEQTAYIDRTNLDEVAMPSSTDVYQGDADVEDRPETEGDRYDMLLGQEMRGGETEDTMEAVEEGITYIPPVDPPMSMDPDSGTGQLDLMDREDDDDLTARVRDALRSDSSTIGLVGRLRIATIGAHVVVRGEVDDLDDTDNIVAVISEVQGVDGVRDETTVRGL
ncbi:MAG: hypothetical protein NVS4B8_12090 [Herpetosiphon sp.]